MNFNSNLKWWIVLFVIIAIIFSVIIAIFIINPSNNKSGPLPTLSNDNLEKDYSRLDEITPGKTTLEEVKKINGEPKSIKNEGGKTILTYKTPSQAFENLVVIENNRVSYTKENVFGTYRGNFSEFKAKNGEPDLLLFSEDFGWSVYLNKGIAIQHDAKDIGTLVYFIPQSKENFMSTIAKDFALSEKSALEEEPYHFGEITPSP